ncbi:hypothetical protein HanRHA438_Chr01g0020421 [Helianthus annuus]|nr:hypothetical protein HanRHA438_Chr01g0020421 [Helianthus annuus]
MISVDSAEFQHTRQPYEISRSSRHTAPPMGPLASPRGSNYTLSFVVNPLNC